MQLLVIFIEFDLVIHEMNLHICFKTLETSKHYFNRYCKCPVFWKWLPACSITKKFERSQVNQ